MSLANGVAAVVSLSRMPDHCDLLVARRSVLGVALDTDAGIDVIGPHLGSIDLVVLEFPAFVDGRQYSYAVRMRTFWGGAPVRSGQPETSAAINSTAYIAADSMRANLRTMSTPRISCADSMISRGSTSPLSMTARRPGGCAPRAV